MICQNNHLQLASHIFGTSHSLFCNIHVTPVHHGLWHLRITIETNKLQRHLASLPFLILPCLSVWLSPTALRAGNSRHRHGSSLITGTLLFAFAFATSLKCSSPGLLVCQSFPVIIEFDAQGTYGESEEQNICNTMTTMLYICVFHK